ncbi:LarC family nickel insertion protein [Clostridium sp. PL3]|uniref:LarC family nickel insertion protein n=1 Tax=Clostridium thailandense TaxID=2794346 RepID=A0A949TW60_9CLOT|nr:LarC family nickel insertion protein [Clostridium thailandense]
MKVLYYDCFSGISGDMNLGALIDIGVDKDYLISELLKLNISGYEIKAKKDVKNGISGTKADVILEECHNHDEESNCEHNHEAHEHGHGHHHEHGHEGHHEHHHHEHQHTHPTTSHHEHRNLMDIKSIIEASTLNQNVKNISLEMFKKVAEAEAKVHNKSIEEVHFHEVGAVDSIVDIVGAAIGLDYLKVDKIECSTVEVGSGFVKCAHGILPVPAPATAEILKNIPIKVNIPFEATTPTGAAILSYLVDEFTDAKNFRVERIGYGLGSKENAEIPNMLRIFIGERN